MRALYDLYDANSDGPFDQVQLGLGATYDIMVDTIRNTNGVSIAFAAR